MTTTENIPVPTAEDFARDLGADYADCERSTLTHAQKARAALRLAAHYRVCRDQLAEGNVEMAGHIAELRIIIDGLSARVAAQSDQLSRNAERVTETAKDYRVNADALATLHDEVVRLNRDNAQIHERDLRHRQALARIVDMAEDGRARTVAATALGVA